MPSNGFFQKVYKVVRQVPTGHVVTYGQIAATLDHVGRARVVGWAMRASPNGVPWHRVVNADGKVSTRTACGGSNFQRLLLEDEGVKFDHSGRIDLAVYGWSGMQANRGNREGQHAK